MIPKNVLYIGLIFLVCGHAYKVEEARLRREVPTVEECMKPPMKRFAHECCRLPRERIWGDLRESLNKCMAQLKQERRLLHQETEVEADNSNTMMLSEMPTADDTSPKDHHRHPKHHVPHHDPKPHHFQRNPKDQCFMECVFEDQGFLTDKKVNKEALLERLNKTLEKNEVWHDVAAKAVNTCHEMGFPHFPTNSSCLSGSEEIFRCIFKQIFFNCPTWPERNEYCSSLKEFYQKCPDGPPPEAQDNHSSTPSDIEKEEEQEEEKDEETSSSTEKDTQE